MLDVTRQVHARHPAAAQLAPRLISISKDLRQEREVGLVHADGIRRTTRD